MKKSNESELRATEMHFQTLDVHQFTQTLREFCDKKNRVITMNTGSAVSLNRIDDGQRVYIESDCGCIYVKVARKQVICLEPWNDFNSPAKYRINEHCFQMIVECGSARELVYINFIEDYRL